MNVTQFYDAIYTGPAATLEALKREYAAHPEHFLRFFGCLGSGKKFANNDLRIYTMPLTGTSAYAILSAVQMADPEFQNHLVKHLNYGHNLANEIEDTPQ